MSLPPEFRPTNNDPSVGTPNFNRLAGPYRWMERLTFGPCLAWCRFAFLARAASCRHALVLGDGDGRFAARLLRANPHIHIDAVDASSSMLRALNENAGPHAARVRTHLADARQWHPAAGSPYDLVVTHFFLDCLTTLSALLYRSFRQLTGLTVRTLPDHPTALRSAGFTLIERRPRLAGLLVSELWAVKPFNLP
jgi:SAM-dependent methyltransferase